MANGSSGRLYMKSLMAALINMGASHGYALVIWGSGALGIAHYQAITPLDAIAHVGGALIAFPLLIVLLFHPRQIGTGLAETSFPAYGFLHVSSVPLALGACYIIYLIVPWPILGFGLSGFFSSLVFFLVFALELLLAMSRKRQQQLQEQEHTYEATSTSG